MPRYSFGGISFRSDEPLSPEEIDQTLTRLSPPPAIQAAPSADIDTRPQPEIREQRSYIPHMRDITVGAGAALGGTVGAATGIPALGVGAVPGALVGAGLGGTAAGSLYDAVTAREMPSWTAPFTRGAHDLWNSVLGEAGGRAAMPILGKAAKVLGLSRGLSPGEQALQAAYAQQGITPRTSELLGSEPAAKAEKAMSYTLTGSGPYQAAVERQAGEASGAAERLAGRFGRAVDPAEFGAAAQNEVNAATARTTTRQNQMGQSISRLFGTTVSPMEFGVAAQADIRTGLKAWKAESSRVFDKISGLAGDEPVIQPDRLKDVLTELMDTQAAPTPRVVGKMIEKAEGPPIPESIRVAGLEETWKTVQGAGQTGLTFDQARSLQAQLGDKAFRGGAVGTPVQGQLKALHGAIGDDIERFLAAHEPVNTALAEAKQAYRVGKDLWNTQMTKLVTGSRRAPLPAEDVGSKVFAPGGLTETLDFKQAASPELWEKAQAAWLTSVSRKALKPDGSFDPAAWVAAMAPYQKSGQFAVIAGDRAGPLTQVTDAMRVASQAPATGTSKVLARLGTMPGQEDVLRKVFPPGGLSETLAFRQSASDELWTKAQAAWVTDLYRTATVDTPKGQMFSPAKWVRAIDPYQKSGQLDAIAGEQAEAVLNFTEVMRTMKSASALAAQPSGTAQGTVSHAQAGALLWGLLSGNLGRVAEIAGVPWLYSKGILSAPGQAALRRVFRPGLTGDLAAPAARTGVQALTQGAAADEETP